MFTDTAPLWILHLCYFKPQLHTMSCIHVLLVCYPLKYWVWRVGKKILTVSRIQHSLYDEHVFNESWTRNFEATTIELSSTKTKREPARQLWESTRFLACAANRQLRSVKSARLTKEPQSQVCTTFHQSPIQQRSARPMSLHDSQRILWITQPSWYPDSCVCSTGLGEHHGIILNVKWRRE